MQVQTRTEQTAVTFSSSTPVTKTVAGSASSAAVGSCVLVRDDSGATSSSVTATAVTVSQPVRGACRTNAFGAGAGAGSGGGRGHGGGAAGIVGTVSAVQGSALTVVPFIRAAGATATPSPTTAAPVAVAVTAATTWTVVEKGAASDVTVGECVTAVGKADDTGSVAATSLSLRPAVDGACTFGRGGAGGSGGAGGGANSGGGANGGGAAATATTSA